MDDNQDRRGSRVSRRSLLKAAGAGAVGTGLGGLLGACSIDDITGQTEDSDPTATPGEAGEQETPWDEQADIVVVGSGVAGATAAVTAAENGSSAIILEKAQGFGGTSAKSGGGYWIPNNPDMREAGLDVPREEALQYMARLAYPWLYYADAPRFGLPEFEYSLIEAFYDNASEAIESLEEMNALSSVMNENFPDYFAHLPENTAPYGRIMNPVGPEGNPGGGAEMMRQLRSALDDRNVSVLLEHRVEQIVQDNDGRAVGVIASNSDGSAVRVGANQAVIFGSGGFTHNPAMRVDFLRGPIFGGCAVPTSEGDFIDIGIAAGAKLANTQNAWWAEIVLEQAIELSSVPNDVWQPPGDSMIVVNRYGDRVADEKFAYNERTQVHFYWDPVNAEFKNLLLFMLYDERTAQEFAGTYPLPAEDQTAPYVISGETWEELTSNIQDRLNELAEHTGNFSLADSFMDTLPDTVETFNEYAEQGTDPRYQRGEQPIDVYFHNSFVPGGDAPEHEYPNQTMHPISSEGPYYCIILAGGTLDTKGGPVVDASARVLDTNNEPIPGLYGAGNCIASPAGYTYWAGGSTLGPAITYGYIAGRTASGAEEPTEAPTGTPEATEGPTATATPGGPVLTPTGTPDGTAAPTATPEAASPTATEEAATSTPEQASPTATEEAATATSTAAATATEDAQEGQEHVVEMTDQLVFDPEEITIDQGDTIVWRTVGTVAHTSTCDPELAINPDDSVQLPDGAEPWDSGLVAQGEEYRRTFDVAGEYTYFCIPHESQGMIGYITVRSS